MATTTRKPWTADELIRLPQGWRYEIDEVELVVMPPAGFGHGEHVGDVTGLLTRTSSRARCGCGSRYTRCHGRRSRRWMG